MLKIIVAQSEAQIQQVRELSRGYIRGLIEFDLALGIYDPAAYESYGYASGEAELPGEYIAPDGCLLLALNDATPVGCVALHRLDASSCELRLLFVRPEFQKRGIGKALILRLIDEAKQMDFAALRLETSKVMSSAYGLYLALGFREIAPYYEIPEILKDVEVFMEKLLL